MTIPDTKLMPCPMVKEKVAVFYCRECFFHGKEYCKQYQTEVAEKNGEQVNE